jgi:predicted DsbA family dithiol-disulfide isomerase
MAGRLEALFGAEQLASSHARLRAMGAEVGIAYDFDAVSKAANTRLAHALVTTYDGDPRQRPVLRGLYAAYFEQGRDVTDPATLVEVATAVTGETPAEVTARLEAPQEALEETLALGRVLGVTGVPTFVADAGTDVDPQVQLSSAAVAVQGAQDVAVLAQVLDEARRRSVLPSP